MARVNVSTSLARQLGVESIFTERRTAKCSFGALTVGKGDKILIAEDVITTENPPWRR
jgi:orotate phosphoribosyltransferase